MAPHEKTLEDLRIAVAHDWLTGRAGGEKTFEQLAESFPTADVYALTANPRIDWEFGGRTINTTFLDRRGLRERRSLTLPLMPAAWRLASRQRYDVVISSSVACVKGFFPGRSALHLSYVHAPMRYVWEPEIDRRTRLEIPKPILNAFRNWDRAGTSSGRWPSASPPTWSRSRSAPATKRCAISTGAPTPCSSPVSRTSGSSPWKPRPAERRSWP